MHPQNTAHLNPHFAINQYHGIEWHLGNDTENITLESSDYGFDINNPKHKIIVCGDLFDRGHQPKQIIDFILAHKDKFILIRGNHEDLMQEMINRNFNMKHDLSNGTAFTILDLCPEYLISEFDLKKIAKETGLQEVLDMCVDYFETKKFLFVHGWIPTKSDNKYNSNWRNASKKQWEKARWQNPVEMFVVCRI